MKRRDHAQGMFNNGLIIDRFNEFIKEPKLNLFKMLGRVVVAQGIGEVIRNHVEADRVLGIDIDVVQTRGQEDRQIAREIKIDAIGTETMIAESHHITTRVVGMVDVEAGPGVK